MPVLTSVPLGASGLEVSPICLGGNVFGWAADAEESFAVLDAYTEAGGTFIDTADSYSYWVPGHVGGESETILGEWMAARGNRDQVVVATKVFSHPQFPGLSAANITAAAEASLRRLQTDHIDLYFAHRDDANTPLEETLGAFDALVAAGKVRAIGASNYSAERLAEALGVSQAGGLARYTVLQQHYNLLERDYEGALRDVVTEHGLTTVPYYALAAGFLTGKYRDGVEVDSVRKAGASRYLDDRGRRVLEVLDKVGADHGVPVASVALAWLAAQPTVGAPIASARNVEQVGPIVTAAALELSAGELAALSAASEA